MLAISEQTLARDSSGDQYTGAPYAYDLGHGAAEMALSGMGVVPLLIAGGGRRS
ncbi:hypothetical protein ACGFX8_22205 [Streptomyces sp. NPDC048362]|uniref:hypothetical protein n=1 Tax=Streptomyces sp. NPDC048362 TaxID=3365539 RepID=UPI0037100522